MGVTEDYKLSMYEDYGVLGEKKNIHIVRDRRNGRICVKKEMDSMQKEIIEFRKQNRQPCYPELLEVIEIDGALTIIEEYIEGVTLNEYMMGEKLSEEKAVNFARQICKALMPLHHANPSIVYRDLKAENIMVTRDELIKLVDFNISRAFQEGKKRDTVLLGTAEYAAPEQFGYFQTDNRTDIYAFGVLFNYMLTGKFPVEQITEGRYAELIRKCTEMEPSRRYQRIEDVLQELGNYAEVKAEVPDMEVKMELSRGGTTGSVLKSWAIPGFRTGKIWKMIVSVIVYILLISSGMDTEFYQDDGTLCPVASLWIRRIFMTVAMLGCVFYAFNYMGIADKIKIFRRRAKWIHVVESFVIGFGILFIAAAAAVVLEMILGI